ncbi:anthrone oxygenase family protein [Vagococcus salmoninarum]|uniref:anthrone oxygenase family protein n=1 Tax=Vagococcus salmoninarum TaxID=2739 RepID=UPI003F9C7F3B
MFHSFIDTIIFFAALGSGLMAGMFFSFSSFIMAALSQISPKNGISAMQSINLTVLNPLFFSIFFGTAGISGYLLITNLSPLNWSQNRYLMIASLLYLLGTFAVTVIFNVPLNNKLANISAETPEAEDFWQIYLKNWTFWNHFRALTSLGAMASYILSLIN